MKTDNQIQAEINNELNRELAMIATEVKVSVKNGSVTLEGVAESYAKKIETQRAAFRIEGVISVTNNIVLKINHQPSDEDIKKTVIKMITWNSCIDENRINVEVLNGWVTLTGEVDYNYQKSKATFLTEDIMGVAGVTNRINIVTSYEKTADKLSA
ncbi:MAG: BON domain-containing protein [Bacteroidia bacterium]